MIDLSLHVGFMFPCELEAQRKNLSTGVLGSQGPPEMVLETETGSSARVTAVTVLNVESSL